MERPEPLAELDWPANRARAFAEQAVDLWAEHVRVLPSLPVSRPHTPAEVRAALSRPVPDDPVPDDVLFAHLRELIMERSTQTGHGGWMGYISGAGTVPGGPASLLAAGSNQNLGGWPLGPGATEIESQLLAWFADRLGLPASTSGAFVSGGATANLIALTVARDALAGWNVRRDGIAAGPPLAVYVSDDAHETIDRAADLLGLGSAAVRRIETDTHFRVRPDAVRAAIEQDIAAGVRPLCVVGTAGTTELGAIDPLAELADVAVAYDCWFHVDAAYGGPAAMVDELKPLFNGIERADSITCDPHKWLNTPISSSLVLVRDPARHLAAFTLRPDYAHLDAELEQDMVNRYQWTPQFTRPFDALPVWVSLLSHGWSAYARRIVHDIELTRWLHHLVTVHPELEPLAEPDLSIVCFRYVPARLADNGSVKSYLDELNEQIIYAVQRAGRAYPSNAVVAGDFAIRACLVGYRTEAEHVEALVDDVIRFGRQLDGERQAH
ncbi:MAG TPA: pyridoxal-dependent decarboxylase [Jiangellaceae bacterium]|nr:pyridoxal-dependent decarboxylase [Jiangellaceae bacterium]